MSGGLRRFGRGVAVNVLTIGSSMFLSACVLPMGSPSLDWRIHKDGACGHRHKPVTTVPLQTLVTLTRLQHDARCLRGCARSLLQRTSQDRENAILILAVVVGADEHAQGSLATWHAVLVLSETYIRCTLTCSFVQGPAPTLGVTPGGTPTSILDIWSSNFQDASLTNGTSTGCAQNARSA